MNEMQTKAVKLVSFAIRGKKLEQNQLENINWHELLEFADSHHIKAVIYASIANISNLTFVDQCIMQQWKKETLLTAINQLQHIRQVSIVLSKFNELGIPVVVLKGLVIRELYPRPELRTMCDADILVRRSNLGQAKNIMESLGYIEGEKSPLHISYINKVYRHIEIHWTIKDQRFFESIGDFEDDMWQHSEKVKIGESEALSFSPEDMAIHLCAHMATHILTSGFGVRQLCDLVLLVEKKGELINWISFYNKGKLWGIEKFIVAIFMICNRLFDMDIPDEISENKGSVDNKVIELLIDDILSGGVYGKKDLPHMFANEFAYGTDEQEIGNLIGVIKRFLRLIFPPISRMSDKYHYARKHKLLIPIAWIDHLISGIKQDKYEYKEKIRFLKSSIFISGKRHKLLKKLGL